MTNVFANTTHRETCNGAARSLGWGGLKFLLVELAAAVTVAFSLTGQRTETMETKTFPLRVVLTVVTGRFLTAGRGPDDNGIGDLYDLLGWMTADTPWTTQLGRFASECKPWLLRWFPELEPVLGSMNSLDDWIAHSPTAPDEGVKIWLAEIRLMFPQLKDEYAVPQIPPDDHDRKDPYDELVADQGTDEKVIIASTDYEGCTR